MDSRRKEEGTKIKKATGQVLGRGEHLIQLEGRLQNVKEPHAERNVGDELNLLCC